jgi:predicted permease
MSMIDGLLHRLSVLWRGERYAQELEEEMRFHRELDAQAGAAPEHFGSATYYREERRATTLLRWVDRARQDTTYAVRSLRRTPGFSLGVILILALGFGVNAGMFSLFDALYLRVPSGVVAPSNLRRLYIQTHATAATPPQTYAQFNYPSFRVVSAANGGIPMAAATEGDSNIVSAAGMRRGVRISEVSGTYFDVLGVRPEIGRFFMSDERAIESPTFVTVISDRLWRAIFHGASNAIGQTIRIGRRPFTIIGVAPRDFAGIDLDAIDVWTPLNTHIGEFVGISGPWYTTFGSALEVIARLPATASERALVGNATDAYRSVHLMGWGYDPKANVLTGPIMTAAGPMKPSDEMLVARRVTLMALAVLLIAAANAGNLMLLRVSRRAREIAVRRALGVASMRLVEQIALESVVLSIFAAASAAIVAYWTATASRNLAMPRLHISVPVLDARTVGFIFAMSLGIGLVVGIIPAITALRANLSDSLRAGSRDVSYRRSRVRQALVVIQTALCLVLLVAAGLFVRSLDNVRSIDVGYDRDHLVLVSANFDEGPFSHAEELKRALPLIAQRLRQLPSVRQVALSQLTPMGGAEFAPLHLPGRDSLPHMSDIGMPTGNAVSPSFFKAAGLRIIEGRDFTEQDKPGAPRAMIVTSTMARAFWPNESPLGKCLIVGDATDPCTIVIGVVQDAHAGQLVEGPKMMYFRPLAQTPRANPSVIELRMARATGPALVAVRVEAGVATHELLPSALGADVKRIDDLLVRELRPWVLGVKLFTGFAILALVVAAFGIYSVVAYGVSQRTNELGIRVTLGARASDIVDLVVADGIRTVGVGMGLGLAAALLTTRLLNAFLFGVTAQDPAVFAGCIAVLTALATLACAIPAWRASRIDPATALRIE